MKTIQIPTGIITISESKAICPHCKRHIPFEDIETKYMKSDKDPIRIKCKCKRFIGVTMNLIGDFVVFEL